MQRGGGARFKARREPPRLLQAFYFIFFLPGAGADLLGLPWHWPDCSFPSPRLLSPSSKTLPDRAPSPGLRAERGAPKTPEGEDARSFLPCYPLAPPKSSRAVASRMPSAAAPRCHLPAGASPSLRVPGRQEWCRPAPQHRPPPLGSGESKLILGAREGSCEFCCFGVPGLVWACSSAAARANARGGSGSTPNPVVTWAPVTSTPRRSPRPKRPHRGSNADVLPCVWARRLWLGMVCGDSPRGPLLFPPIASSLPSHNSSPTAPWDLGHQRCWW